MADPALDIATHLQNNGLGTIGVDLFVSQVAPDPEDAIFVVPPYGGLPAQRVLGGATEIRFPTVQVRVRRTSYATGYTAAKNAYAALQGANISGYMSCEVLQSEPIYLGTDENGWHSWSLNVRLTYQA